MHYNVKNKHVDLYYGSRKIETLIYLCLFNASAYSVEEAGKINIYYLTNKSSVRKYFFYYL